MSLQVVALIMLTVNESLLTIVDVMCAQALSGIAKDLNKMSAKTSVKLMLLENQEGRPFRWVAVLAGSKKALKGVGFFIGGLLLTLVVFRGALFVLSLALGSVLIVLIFLMPKGIGRSKAKPKFTQIFSNIAPSIFWPRHDFFCLVYVMSGL